MQVKKNVLPEPYADSTHSSVLLLLNGILSAAEDPK